MQLLVDPPSRNAYMLMFIILILPSVLQARGPMVKAGHFPVILKPRTIRTKRCPLLEGAVSTYLDPFIS